MPWMLMYLVDRDVKALCEMLDADEDIALIRSAGRGKWKAQRNVPTLPDGEHVFWHIPSGPIELEDRQPKGRVKVVANPFRTWSEIEKPVHAGVPWFGPAPLGIFRLTIRRRAGRGNWIFSPTSMSRPWEAPASEVIGRTDLFWVGNFFSTKKNRAPKVTEKWWDTMRRRVAKVAKQIPATGPIERGRGEIWAWPGALEEIRAGRKRADNPT